MRWPIASSCPFTTGSSVIRPTPSTAHSGQLMIGVNASMPAMPRFEMVKVPPLISSTDRRRALARSARSRVRSANSGNASFAASRTTGTTSPASVSTANPMFTDSG